MHRTFYTCTFIIFICKYNEFQIKILRNLVEAEGIQGLSFIVNDHKRPILYKLINIYEKPIYMLGQPASYTDIISHEIRGIYEIVLYLQRLHITYIVISYEIVKSEMIFPYTKIIYDDNQVISIVNIRLQGDK